MINGKVFTGWESEVCSYVAENYMFTTHVLVCLHCVSKNWRCMFVAPRLLLEINCACYCVSPFVICVGSGFMFIYLLHVLCMLF